MASERAEHRRTHSLLLISRLFDARQRASPFTLILDSLEQSGTLLVQNFIKRTKAGKGQVLFFSFERLARPKGVDHFIKAGQYSAAELQTHVTLQTSSNARRLVVIDSLNAISALYAESILTFLTSLLSPTTSVVGVFHTDIPSCQWGASPYAPQPLTLLRYFATTILTAHSTSHILAQKAAKDRSLQEPTFGLDERVEGVIVGLGANDGRGVVVEMESRRKSGRGVTEWFILPRAAKAFAKANAVKLYDGFMLLEDFPLYSSSAQGIAADQSADQEQDVSATFNLSLTEKQRRDREGVVLPYFDAQKASSDGGTGGRILYDMGVEDDFDEEEDEI